KPFLESDRTEQQENLTEEKGVVHFMLDHLKANEIILFEAGILPEHLDVTDLCTCCNSDKLFSHRASHGKRGNLGCFMCLD
ncbi:MAG: polyphenol oxidase family protein, partial [Clostridiales bacterium]|nr:polyphenol oxidase family protein [Clostridiales bacterium]